MIENIDFPKVEGVAIAIVHEQIPDEEDKAWYVYIINQNEKALQNVLVTSKGYGENLEGEKQKTTTLRYNIEELKPQTAVKLEPIIEEVFALHNEYWVSYYIDKKIYDKKFIFPPESIVKENLTNIPVLETKGILHK